MGLLDRLLGRTITGSVGTRKTRSVTTKWADGSVTRKQVESDGSTFDEWVQSMEARSTSRTRAPRVKKDTIVEAQMSIIDLRSLDYVRTRIKGTANYLNDGDRAVYGGTEYVLVREPKNPNDADAVAIYGNERKVGYVSAAKAASMSSVLDGISADAFRVSGTSVIDHSIVLWVDLPRISALRVFARSVGSGS